jgi:uncharacterized protein YjiS (DUF1127 family)
MHIARVPLPVAASLASPVRPVSRGTWRAWLEAVLARWAERRQLLTLGERDLHDIGLTPSDARALALKPLWRR